MSEPAMRNAKRLHKAGRIAEAVELYQQILRANPRHAEALYGLGMAEAQGGRLEDAAKLLADALKLSPGFAEGWRARGMMLAHLGRFEEARASFDRAIALKPDFAEALAARAHLPAPAAVPRSARDAIKALDTAPAANPNDAPLWNDRGGVMVAMKRMDEALRCFDRALALKPDYVEALCNRATLLFETDKLEESLAGFDAALALDSDIAIVWNNRGNVLTKLGRFEEALASYNKALELQPEFPEAKENRELPLFEMGETSRSPAKYMRGLFDGFSGHYDDTMLTKLGYRAHLHVRAIADRILPQLKRPMRMFDLGCGTGLVGEAFKDLIPGGWLDGIDLSPRMIEAARKRGLYSKLIVGDIEKVLAEPGTIYNLIVSADTMTYFGDLALVFSGVATRLEKGGFYLFASEAKEGDGWEKTKVHRFRHSEAYLREEAAKVGFHVTGIERVTLRHEENEPVAGFAVALNKPV